LVHSGQDAELPIDDRVLSTRPDRNLENIELLEPIANVPQTQRPYLEQLESREVPATFGNGWADPLQLTTSFAPDSTQVGDRSSNLFSLLGKNFAEVAWKTELLRAIQSWVSVANLNVGLKGDDGSDFGTGILPLPARTRSSTRRARPMARPCRSSTCWRRWCLVPIRSTRT